MNNVIPFNFEDHPVRVVKDAQDKAPWFVAADVCRVLAITKPENTYKRLDDDEKGTRIVGTPGGNQNMTVVNEFGLYSLILTSRKPEAKRFKRWVTHEVLPAIRRTGRYEEPAKPASIQIDSKRNSYTATVNFPPNIWIIDRDDDETLDRFTDGNNQAYLAKVVFQASSSMMKQQSSESDEKGHE